MGTGEVGGSCQEGKRVTVGCAVSSGWSPEMRSDCG